MPVPIDIFLDPPFTGATATAFLARTSGLDATHVTAYTDLLNGLDADSLTSKFDVLHVYATQDSTTALLNLVSSNFNGTSHGSPTFTTDRGFTGVESSTTVYIDTGFDPSTAGSPKLVQNSAHLSLWGLTSGTTNNASLGAKTAGKTAYLITRYVDGNFYARMTEGETVGGVSAADSLGHFVGNRSDSTNIQRYKNSTALAATTTTSTGVPATNIYSLANSSTGTVQGSGQQLAMISFGSSLSSTDVTNFYNRLRTYMTAVGVA